ncbi:MAG: pentapeptide repeat-containing protein [Cyanophyceae cyanobacterium]
MIASKIIVKLAGLVLSLVLFLPLPAQAQATKYYDPPPSYSNAELSGRDFSGDTLRAAEFSNANLELANFSRTDLRGSILSASVATKANFHGADLSYGMADQIDFTGADLSDAVFVETIMLRSTFEDANITGADFTSAILDGDQVKKLCAKATGINSQTGVATRDSLLCQ